VTQAVLWPLEGAVVKSELAASALSEGVARSPWRSVWVSAGETKQQQHNKALHPTAYSSVRSSLLFRRRVSLVVVPVRAVWLRCRVSWYERKYRIE